MDYAGIGEDGEVKQEINWNYCQQNSNDILIEGLNKLQTSKDNNLNSQGNYLISHDNINYYIGEGKDLNKRLKQQFNLRTSTFYKNYQKKFDDKHQINDFEVKVIQTNIGRKEIEEFGIVNLQTPLNKFQLGKRDKIECKSINNLWDDIQDNYQDLLIQGEKNILNQKHIFWFNANLPSKAGIYLVFDNSNNLIYIGESSNIQERHKTHSGVTYFSALRRHIGKTILKFDFVQIKSKRPNREFLEKDDIKITQFLKECTIKFMPISFGRFELEEYLIRKHNPLLNKKENKKSS